MNVCFCSTHNAVHNPLRLLDARVVAFSAYGTVGILASDFPGVLEETLKKEARRKKLLVET